MRLAVLGPFGLMHDRILHHRQWWFHEDACDITAGCEALPPVQGLTSMFGCKSQSCCCGWLDLTPLQAGFVLGLLQHVMEGGVGLLRGQAASGPTRYARTSGYT